jgi:NAD(P)H-dependent FMN reductase
VSRRVLLLAGSSRMDSQSGKVAHYLAGRLQSLGACAEVLDLAATPLPLWPAPQSCLAWQAMAERLRAAEALVVVSPEWQGMVSPALKNLFVYAGRTELAHKPALLVGVSAGQGGAYPLSELRASSYKNCRICYIPEQLIVRQVEQVLNDEQAVDEADKYIRTRADWALQVLLEYAEALHGLAGKVEWRFVNGM